MKRMLAFGLAGLLVVALTAYTVTSYFAGPALAVTDGSITGVIEGNLTSITSGNPLFLSFNATTYVNQTGRSSSTLAIHVDTVTAYAAGPPGYCYSGGDIQTNVYLTIIGRFAANLHPQNMTLTVNETGAGQDILAFLASDQTGVNVTFGSWAGLVLAATGSGMARETLVNRTGTGPYYEFSYHAGFEARGFLGHNRFLGFRADIMGLDAPVGVGVLLAIVDVPGGA